MKKGIIAIGVLFVLIIGYYLARPLFVDDIVNEDFPELALMGLEEQDALLAMPDQDMIDSMEESEKEALEKSMLEKSSEVEVVVEEEMMEMSTIEEQYPRLIEQGQFRDADDFHKGSGEAKLIQLNEVDQLLRLENFEVTNGPDLFVYLTKKENPASSSEVKEGFLDLGRLKGNKGNQNYAIPSDVDLSEYNGVVIYCRAFSTLFSVAPLS